MTDILPADGSITMRMVEPRAGAGVSRQDPGDFNEAQYLLNNPDVAQAVYDGYFASGWET